MRKLSEINETWITEEPTRAEPPKSERQRQILEFAHNKSKKTEIIKTWTKLTDHPKAKDMNSEVGSAFDEADLDEDMRAAYEAIGDGGIIYCSFEDSFWVRHKDQLIRVMQENICRDNPRAINFHIQTLNRTTAAGNDCCCLIIKMWGLLNLLTLQGVALAITKDEHLIVLNDFLSATYCTDVL